jgi:hypothetical protein
MGKGGEALKDAWEALSASRRAYMTRYLGATGEPQCATAPVMPEPMQTDPTLRVDLRTAEERDRGAKQAWLIWEARIARLPAPQMKWAVAAALGDSINPEAARLWGQNGLPTSNGQAFIMALRVLAGMDAVQAREGAA